MKKTTKKIYAVILIILMLLNYMPIISKAVEYNATLALESTASSYSVGDEVLVDLKATELTNTGAIKQFAGNIQYDNTALELKEIVVTETGYSNESNVTNSRILITKSSGDGTLDVGDVICTLKFTALKSSETQTVVKVYDVDATCNDEAPYYDDGTVNSPEITLPVEQLTISHNLKITKTTSTGSAIQNNSALFKIVDLTGKAIYAETEEDGTLTLSDLAMPTTTGPFVYTIQEILAPTGYVVNENALELTVTFTEDGTVSTATLSNGTANIVAETNTIELSISNQEEVVKPEQEVFNLVLNKVDEQGQSITTDSAEFTLSMPDGTTTNCATNASTGKTDSISILAPEEAGTYPYVIKETKAPTGYITEESNIIVELTYEEQSNKIVLTSGNIVSYNNEAVTPTTVGTTKTLTLNIKNEQEIVTYNYSINIDKVKNDTFKSNITEDSAIFEITKDSETSYVKTNTLGKATFEFSMTNKDIVEGNNYTYTIKEIKAPEGYILDETPKTVTLTFNSNGSINTMNVSGANIEKGASTTYTANVKIVNEEKPQEVVLVPESFNLSINKVDELGNLITTDAANFVLTTPDGTRKAITTTNGKSTAIELVAPSSVEKQVYFLQETKAPEGYNILNESLAIEMNYIESDGKIALASATIKDYNNEVVTPVTTNGVKTLSINVKNNKIKTFEIEINGVNRENTAISSGTTVVKVTNKETQEYFYEEVTMTNGKIKLDIPETEGTVGYEIEQIKAPEGYEINSNKITMQMTFAKNSNNELELQDYTVEGIDVQKGTTTQKNTASIIIINDEIPVEPQKQNYSLEIDKLDSETNSLITENSAVFTIISADAKTKDEPTTNGKIVINGLVPGEAGEEVIFVIKEKTAPEGYTLSEKSIVIKVRFEEENGTIYAASTQVLLGTDIATAEMVGTTVKVNVLNEKENDELYVVSKKYEDGIDIYNIFNSYTGRHYSIENPFIDTKVAKLGNNITVQEFLDNLDSNGVLTVWDLDGNQVPNGNKIKTKMVLKATKGEQELTFTVVIKGDSDGDGRVRTKDLNMLVRHLANEEQLTSPIELRALDLVEDAGDGLIRTTDLNMYYNVLAQ